MVYPALLPLMRTPRLTVVDLSDAPADLNGLVRFAERQNLVSARVPTHFNWPLLRISSVLFVSRVCVCVCHKLSHQAVIISTKSIIWLVPVMGRKTIP